MDYMPILKWKRGEQTATKVLPAKVKAQVMPLAEVPEPPFDWEDNKPKKSLEEHIQDVAKATALYWGRTYPIAFDQPFAEPTAKLSGGSTAWELLFEELWGHGVEAIPVVSSMATSAELAAFKSLARAHDIPRWVLRWRADSATETVGAGSVANWLLKTAEAVGARPEQCVAVIDCGYVDTGTLPGAKANAAAWVGEVASAGKWERVVLASGAFPVNLAGHAAGSVWLPRSDWELYESLHSSLGAEFKVAYADYAVSHVLAFNDDPRLMRMSANLRYTTTKHWLVFKGKNVKDHGFGQYKSLCKLLVANKAFKGASFSAGDKNYAEIAGKADSKPGNATHWRRDATNHHIHFVIDQLASLDEL